MRRILIFLLTMLLLASCAVSEGTAAVSLYFPNSHEGDPEGDPLTIVYDVPEGEDRVLWVISKVLDGYPRRGLPSPFDEGISVLGYEYTEEGMDISLSAEYANMTGPRLAVADACLTLSAGLVADVPSVRILAADEAHPARENRELKLSDIIITDLPLVPIEREITLYFDAGDPTMVWPELRNIVTRENEPLWQYVVEELLNGPRSPNLNPVLPDDVTLLSVSVENRICYLNFASNFKEAYYRDIQNRIQTLFSLSKTLTELSGITGVSLLIDGTPLFDRAMGAPKDLSGSISTIVERVELFLAEGGFLLPVELRALPAEGEDMAALAMRKLIEGLDGNGFFSPVPEGTRILSVVNDGRLCTIDLSGEFTEGLPASRTEATAVIQAIVSSVAKTADVDAVRITVEGSADVPILRQISGHSMYIRPDETLISPEYR
ncbi:GerMN domain-containing protein [Oscillospiraceae bacterium OttesenSCG-928-G22]|nr:GerMN domain-containing protein [Oscillospiraceae bacterium OttesenSCG-928-G22]